MATTHESSASRLLLFELEGAALDGRAKLFEAAKGVFKDAGIALTEHAFARYCGQAAPAHIAGQLVAGLGEDKLHRDAAARIINDYIELMKKSAAKPNPKFASLLQEAAKRGMKAAALTVLPESVANDVLAKSGIAAQGVELVLFPEDERHFPRTECWLRHPRAQNKSAHACIAIAGCRDSGKSAVSSGMRCIVVPDQFTAHQDFGGVDAVLDGSEDAGAAEILDAIA